MSIDASSLLSANRIIPSLSTVGATADTTPAAAITPTASAGETSFQDLLTEALGGTVTTDAAAKLSELGLITGESDDLHNLTIASTQADIMLNLTVQIRNRMVEGYQEIMRMQI